MVIVSENCVFVTQIRRQPNIPNFFEKWRMHYDEFMAYTSPFLL